MTTNKPLSKKIISQIVDLILTRDKGIEKIVIFGSRATGEFKNTSDIDIAIFGKDWTDTDINIVKHNLEEFIKTPLKFDVLNFYDIAKPKLKENILEEGRIIYESGKN
ncbi:MAG: nucleotidyltransferase domain-containing protein [Candidatus Omnitrophica bacterium]|nr:nucleotidyltransferase domain-containing protein [Candidatus Omnitrophota bacterium]